MSASIRCSVMQAPSRDCCIGDCLDRAVDGTGAFGVRRGGQQGECGRWRFRARGSASVTGPA